jgi:hypothetical protein
VEHDLHISPGSFTPDDPDWYVFIAKGVLERLAEGNAPFNQTPAEYDGLADDARLVVVGDWGTGLPRARDVAARMHEAIDQALASHRQVHVLHLGDVYYSGLETEDQRPRYEKTARTGPGSASPCSTCSPARSPWPTSMTTGTSPTPRRSPKPAAQRVHDMPSRGAYSGDYALDSLDDRRASW